MTFVQPLIQKFSILEGFSIYLVASVINKALPFFLLPILTYYLTPAEYGILAIYQVFISFAVPLVGMNMVNNITRNFFKQPPEEIARLISNLLIVLSATFSIVIIGLSAYIVLFWEASLENISANWLYTIPVIAAMNTINQFNLAILRNQNKAILYGIFEIFNTILNVSVTLFLVVIYNLGWQGRAGGIFIASLAFGVISLVYIYKSNFLQTDFSLPKIREILVVSVPLIFHALGTVVINLSDRFFIDNMIGKDAVGLYTVGYQFGMIILLCTDSFNKVWSPWMYKQLANVNQIKKGEIVKYTYLYNISIILFALAFTIMSYFLLKIMVSPAYYAAEQFIIWVALGYAVRGMYTMVFPYLVYVGKTYFLGIMTFFTAIINLLANYVLIRLNGAVGAAQATLLSFTILFLGVWWYANQIYPMPWMLSINFLGKYRKRR